MSLIKDRGDILKKEIKVEEMTSKVDNYSKEINDMHKLEYLKGFHNKKMKKIENKISKIGGMA